VDDQGWPSKFARARTFARSQAYRGLGRGEGYVTRNSYKKGKPPRSGLTTPSTNNLHRDVEKDRGGGLISGVTTKKREKTGQTAQIKLGGIHWGCHQSAKMLPKSTDRETYSGVSRARGERDI